MSSFQEMVNKAVAPLRRRVMLMVGRCLATVINNDKSFQLFQIDLGNGEILTNVERVQPYGLSSYPGEETQGVVAFISGNRDNPILLIVDSEEKRIKVAKGDVAVYNDTQARVHLQNEKILLNNDKEETIPLSLQDGVITGKSIDPVTGNPHIDFSTDVRARHGIK